MLVSELSHAVQVFDAQGQLQRVLDQGGHQLIWSPDGSLLASDIWQGAVLLRSADLGEPLWRVDVDGNPQGLRFSPDGSVVLVELWGRGSRLLSAETGQLLDTAANRAEWDLRLDPATPAWLVELPSGQVVLSETDTTALVGAPYRGPVARSPNGDWLAWVQDHQVVIAARPSWTVLGMESGPSDTVVALSWAADGLYAGTEGGQVWRLHPVAERNTPVTCGGRPAQVRGVAPAAGLLVAAGPQGSCVVGPAAPERPLPGDVRGVSLGGDRVAVVVDGHAQLLTWPEGQVLAQAPVPPGWGVSLSPDGDRLLLHDVNRTAPLMQIQELQTLSASGLQRVPLPRSSDRLWLGSGRLLRTHLDDPQRALVSIPDGAAGPGLERPDARGAEGWFSADGRVLAERFEDGQIWVHDLQTARVLARVSGDQAGGLVVDLGVSGRAVSTADASGAVRVVEVSSERMLVQVDGTGAALAVALSPDDAHVGVLRADRVEVWRIADAALVQVILLFDRPSPDLAWMDPHHLVIGQGTDARWVRATDVLSSQHNLRVCRDNARVVPANVGDPARVTCDRG